MILRLLGASWIWFLVPGLVVSQSRVGEWASYTSSLNVQDVIELEGKILGATTGGLLLFDQQTKTFETLTNTDGLAETDLSCVALDRNGHVWVGSSDGVVQILDLQKKKSVRVFDLGISKIADIVTSDSAVYAAYLENVDWGILEFIWLDGEFKYRQIFTPSEERLDYISDLAIRGDSLFAATDRGILVGNYRKHILNYPSNWHHLLDPPLSDVTRLKDLGTEMLIIAGKQIWSYTDSLQLVSTHGSGLRDVTRSVDGTLYGLSKRILSRYDEQGSPAPQCTTEAVSNRLLRLNDGLLLATERGIGFWNVADSSLDWHAPNTLLTNIYTALTVLDDGRLVAAGKRGVSILSEQGWYNLVPSTTVSTFDSVAIDQYTADDYAEFLVDTARYRTNRVWSVVHRDDGRVFFSTQGSTPLVTDSGDTVKGGVVSFSLRGSSDLVVHDTTNGELNPFDDLGFLNVRGLFVDNSSNLWVANFGAANIDKKITVFLKDGHFGHVPQTDLGDAEKLFNPTDIVALDSALIMAGSNQDHVRQGGFFVAKVDLEKDSDGDGISDLADPDDDNDGVRDETDEDDDGDGIPDQNDTLLVDWRGFTTNDGLEVNTVWSLAVDESHTAWALTPKGLQRLTFSEDYSAMTAYFFTYFAGVPFGEGSKVVLDSRGNVWVCSTTSGVYVLLANSTPWPDWNGFRHSNSYLLSDDVTAVAFDDKRGIAYIATSKGINSLKIPFAEKRESYARIVTFPSPFRIPSEAPMVIDGLMDNSSLRIMTLTGHVLREIPPPPVQGYQAFWDGRNNEGSYVGTGIYLVAVYSETGETRVTKIAVIRE